MLPCLKGPVVDRGGFPAKRQPTAADQAWPPLQREQSSRWQSDSYSKCFQTKNLADKEKSLVFVGNETREDLML